MIQFIENGNIDELLFYIAVRICVVLVCWLFMIVSNMIDFWSGTSTAKALGEERDSKGFRRTITKIGDYARVMLFTLMFDILGSFLSFYLLPFATILCAVSIILIECKSVIENSRKKKSHAADVPEIARKIVESKNVKDALNLLQEINQITQKK